MFYRISFVIGISFVITVMLVNAGSLTPSATPASTMHTLEEIYDSVAGTFDSSAITATTTGSLLQNLKYISNNLFWVSSTIGISYTSSRVGIGTLFPSSTLHVVGTGIFTTVSSTGIFFTNATATTLVAASVSSTGITFSNATSSGSVRATTLIGISVSSTGVVFTNATGTGTLSVQTSVSSSKIFYVNASGTNQNLSGYLTVNGSSTLGSLTFANATGTSLIITTISAATVSSTGMTFANATGTGNLQVATAKFTGAIDASSTLNVTGLARFVSADVSNGIQFVTATGTGRTLISASETNAFTLSGGPPVSTTSSLFQLGSDMITGGSASGTFIGINPTTFNGSFIDFQVNSSTKLRVASSGAITVGTSTFISAALLHIATSTPILTVLSSGNIGIATTTPKYALVVGNGTIQKDVYIPRGALCVDNNAGGCPAAPNAGTIYASSTAITAIDLAENYPTMDDTIEPGDVVSFDMGVAGYIKKSGPHDQNVIGIISTSPGVLLGRTEQRARPVALAGRVPVKVSDENGVIGLGDPLVASAIPGVAMRGEGTGRAIGYALEAWWSGTGVITAFVHLSDYHAPPQSDEENNSPSLLAQITDDFVTSIKLALNEVGIWIEEGVLKVKELVADVVRSKKVVTDGLEMKDGATGETYCLRIVSGEWQKSAGECAIADAASSSTTPISLPADPVSPVVPSDDEEPEASEDPAEPEAPPSEPEVAAPTEVPPVEPEAPSSEPTASPTSEETLPAQAGPPPPEAPSSPSDEPIEPIEP